MKRRLVIIGGGPAGLAAAVAAYEAGERDILIIERDCVLGGILNQCIHNGFGLHTFKEELTGPEYAARFEEQVGARGIEVMLNATVLDVNSKREVTVVSERGYIKIEAGAIVLATGCRERPRGGINIPGTRPSGVFSAGTAQRLVNIEGERVGSEVFILGSGDIGLIMARRMTFEGAQVKGVAELMPYSSGLSRNIAQCLNDFNIPLELNTTVTEIRGNGRLESIVLASVDEHKQPIKSTAREVKCDTLLLSVGLLPENELARFCGVSLSRVTGGAEVNDDFMTDVDGVFECGNALHVHDLVDFVSAESSGAGKSAAEYLRGCKAPSKALKVDTSGGVRYSVPQKVCREGEKPLTFRMRVDNVYKGVKLVLKGDGEVIYSKAKPVVRPGEMETVTLSAEASARARKCENLCFSLEGK